MAAIDGYNLKILLTFDIVPPRNQSATSPIFLNKAGTSSIIIIAVSRMFS